MNARSPGQPATLSRKGLAFGVAAYALWGVMPVYFKAIAQVPAIDVVAHRILWSLPFLALAVVVMRGTDKVRAALASRKTLGILLATSLLIGVNWLLFVYAIASGHILAASFGYYLNPLANVLLGRFVLRERVDRLQWIAVAIAAAGISVLAAGALSHLWISLTLCFSFAAYGLLRKVVAADAVTGLGIETAILFPLALLWLGFQFAGGQPVMGSGAVETTMLLLAGVVTAVPLLLFTGAARRLPYSTLGMIQFIAPTLQFLIAVLVYDEAFTTAHAIAFGAIWTALALYVAALVRNARAEVTLPE